MNILIVGAGSVGKRHLKNLISLGHTVGAMDTRVDRLAEVEQLCNRTFTSFTEALSHPWDGVAVCSPPNFHIEQAKEIMGMGFPILMEKPLSITLEEALYLNPYLHVPMLLGYTYRWWKPIQYLKTIIDESALGNILNVRCCMAAHLEDWHPWEHYTEFFMSHKSMGGGALLDESHILDLVLWIFGQPAYVSGKVSKISSLIITTDDNVDVLLDYGHMHITIHLDLYSRPHKREIVVVGDKGTAEWHYDTVTVSNHPNMDKKFEVDRNDMFMGVAQEFIGILEGKMSPSCNFIDGCNVLQLISAIRDSSDTRTIIKCVPLVL